MTTRLTRTVHSVAVAGTFDVANYGDLLFPLILERELTQRLGEVALTIASPCGGPYPADVRRRVARIPRIEEPDFYSWASAFDALVVGGGDIIRLDDAALADIYGVTANEADAARVFRVLLYDLGELAEKVPTYWNAIGVPHDFPTREHGNVAAAVRRLRYRSVRDEQSRARLSAAGVTGEIAIVPDSALAIASLFERSTLQSRIDDLKREGAFPTATRVIALHVGPVSDSVAREIAASLAPLLQSNRDLAVVLVPIGVAHGDLTSHARIAALAPQGVTSISRVLALDEVAAVIAFADGFVGTSLHGAITAFAYGRPPVFLTLGEAGPSKIVEYARRFGGREMVDHVKDIAPAMQRLLDHPQRVAPDALSAIAAELDRHFNRLAEAITSARRERDPEELAIADRMHRDSVRHLRGQSRREVAPRENGLPSVSVVIPVYNGKPFLQEAVASVAAQTVPPCELILVDDGSDDDSLSAIDPRPLPFPVTVLRQPNAGQSSARNLGIRSAKGDVIALLDQDDRWYPHHLERLLQPFRTKPDLGFVYSNLDEIDREGRLVCLGLLHNLGAGHPKRSLADLLSGDMFIVPSATVIRRAALEAVGGFDEQFSGYEDDDLFMRLFRAGFRHVYIDESLSEWRIYGGSSSYSHRMDVSRRRFAEKLMTLYPNNPSVERWWVRDCIAPRFYAKAVEQYHVSIAESDWQRANDAGREAAYFNDLMVRGPRERMRVALMKWPRVYRLAYRWWRRGPTGRAAR